MSAREFEARPRSALRRNLLFMGLTAIFVGYFLVWLPGTGVGLQLIGIEIGEWIKFLEVGAARDLFYLPPIVVGFVLALLAATWPNDRPQTWLARAMAVAVAMLAFPAVAAIQLEPPIEWAIRLASIGFVALVAVAGALIGRSVGHSAWFWILIAVVMALGAILPTWEYFAVLPVVEEIMSRPVGIGVGVWLNLGGAFLVAAVALAEAFAIRRRK